MRQWQRAALIVLMGFAGVAVADLPKVAFDIPARPMEETLKELGRVSGLNVVVNPDLTRGMFAPKVVGSYTPTEALNLALSHTGLRLEYLDDKTVAILGTKDSPSTNPAANATGPQQSLQLAQGGDSSQSSGTEGASLPARDEQNVKIEEVLVTAQRREQRAQDVPGGLQVFTGSELDRLGKDNFESYILDVPGVSFRQQASGSQRIAIRGVSNLAGGEYVVGDPSSTVGLYINDIALSSTAIMPDVQLYDLSRVEVLKGPQGTLYGESAMGGAIKMILNQPDMQRYLANGDVSISSTESGGGLNQAVRAMVNMPLMADKLALRIVGGYKSDAGFVDNVFNGKKDQNDGRSWSGRMVLGANLTDKFSAELLALRDDQHHGEFSQVELARGDLKIGVNEPRFSDTQVSVAGLTLNYDMGLAKLTSISSYFQLDRTFNDTVTFLGPVFVSYGMSPSLYTQESFVAGSITDSYAQELRLVSQGESRFEWVTGAFYRAKQIDADSFVPIPAAELPGVNAALAARGRAQFSGDHGFERHVNDRYEHTAIYAEANFKVIERLQLTAGLRWFDESVRDRDQPIYFGPLAASTPNAAFHSNMANGFIPKAGLKFTMTDHALLYAQAAKGFRSALYNIQEVYQVGDAGADSDNLWNYEVGAKSEWLDGRLILNGSVYYIDWNDIQSTIIAFSPVINRNVGFIDNAGRAEVKGAEMLLQAAPGDHLRFGFNVGYMDAKIAKGKLNVFSGAPLPNAPEWTVSVNTEYRWPFGTLGEGFVRFEGQFVDKQPTKPLSTTNDGEWLPSFTTGSLRLGVEASDNWGVTLFVNNLWDERALLGRGITSPNPTYNPDRYIIMRPRTIGVTVRKSFF